jgi:predicted TIM-barrel fold metal-dependent hydrolase
MIDSFPIISADSHICEPPTLWLDRIDKRYRDRAPRTIHGHAGSEGEFFVAEGLTPRPVARFFGAGVKGEDMPEYAKKTFEAAPASVSDPAARIREQDVDGVAAEVLYTGFGIFLYGLEDAGLRAASFRAYNDFIAEYCSHDPNRLIGLGLIDLEDITDAVSELKRCASKGLRGAMIWSSAPSDKPYNHRYYEPFWTAAHELGIPLSMHAHSGSRGAGVAPAQTAQRTVSYVILTIEIQRSLIEMTLGGVFERHPGLRVVSAENDCSWLPHLMYRLDHAYEEFRFLDPAVAKLSIRPSDYLRQNVFVTFQHEKVELDCVRASFGAKGLMWGSDYPHADSTWPKSREILSTAFAGVPGSDAREMLGQAAARLYGITTASSAVSV